MGALRSLLSKACLLHPALISLINIMPALPLSVRKAMMDICRVQQDPWRNPRLLTSITPVIQFRTSFMFRRHRREVSFLQHVLPVVLDYIHMPLMMGFISMLLRVIPLEDESSAYSALRDGIDKEINCATGRDRPQTLDYRCLFGPEEIDLERSLHPYIPPRRQLNLHFRILLWQWKVAVFRNSRYLFPG